MKKIKCPNCGLEHNEERKAKGVNIYITGVYSAEVDFMYKAEVDHKDSDTKEDSRFIFTRNYNFVPTSFNCNECDHQWSTDVEDYVV